jgi:hypothetical protein
MLIDDCTFGGAGRLDYIVEGFDMLPKSLLKFLTSEVRFQSKVTSVKSLANSTKVNVAVSCKGAACSNSKTSLKQTLSPL